MLGRFLFFPVFSQCRDGVGSLGAGFAGSSGNARVCDFVFAIGSTVAESESGGKRTDEAIILVTDLYTEEKDKDIVNTPMVIPIGMISEWYQIGN